MNGTECEIRHKHVPEDPSAEPEVSSQPLCTAEVCKWMTYIHWIFRGEHK